MIKIGGNVGVPVDHRMTRARIDGEISWRLLPCANDPVGSHLLGMILIVGQQGDAHIDESRVGDADGNTVQ